MGMIRDILVGGWSLIAGMGVTIRRIYRPVVTVQYPRRHIDMSAAYQKGVRERFGNAAVVMDEACVSCDIDLSNRPFLVYELDVAGKVGSFDTELVEEFFRALVFNARISAHIIQQRGKNKHHIIEASFKALAVALRRAVIINERVGIPSTKDVL